MNKVTEVKNELFKIPLVVGVTGHRDIANEHNEILEAKISEIFFSLIKKYPDTPIVFLSPLADGADRIAARVALDDEFKKNISVCVPLPMDEVNYKDSFGKGLKSNTVTPKSSQEEYQHIMHKVSKQENEYLPKIIPMLFDEKLYSSIADLKDNEIDEEFYEQLSSIYLNLPKTKENALKNKKNTQSLGAYIKQKIRHAQYSIVGEYIAIHSNILIALYDESDEEKEGGSKEIVRKKLEGSYDYFNHSKVDVTYPEDGIVYAVATPKGEKFIDNLGKISRLFPSNKQSFYKLEGLSILEKHNYIDTISNWFSQTCLSMKQKKKLNMYTQHHLQLNCFNKDVQIYIGNIKKKYEKDEKLAETSSNDEGFIESKNEINLIKKNIAVRRSAAYLADNVYKPKLEEREKWILGLLSLTVFLLAIKTNISSIIYHEYIDLGYIGLATVSYFLLLKFNEIKKRHEDYRALAEGMRVQTAWNMVGINKSVALDYLSHQKNEIGWIRTSIRSMNIFYLPKPKGHKINKTRVNKYWIKEQRDYFFSKVKSHNNSNRSVIYKDKIMTRKIKMFVVLSILFSGLFSLLDMSHFFKHLDVIILNLTALDFSKIVVLVLPVTYLSYLKAKQLFDGNDELIREYSLSYDIFERASKLLADEQNNAKKIYKNLGIEALRENSAWVITRRTKEYSTPSN